MGSWCSKVLGFLAGREEADDDTEPLTTRSQQPEIAPSLPPSQAQRIPGNLPTVATVAPVGGPPVYYYRDYMKLRERVVARKLLESYMFKMKQTIDDEKVKDKISEEDQKTITERCEETIKWLDSNQLAEKEEFEHKQKELEGICNPILVRVYQW